MKSVNLSIFSNSTYFHGKGFFVRILWMIFSLFFFRSSFPFPSVFKCFILRLFGSDIGKNVVIRSSVNIKHPWFLKIGSNCWIGEGVWIDNLVLVSFGNNVCISQGAMLLTGNHNYKSSAFDLMTSSIFLEDGVWIGAKSLVGPGVLCKSHSILVAGSCAFTDLDTYSIYQGNPALFKRKRFINE